MEERKAFYEAKCKELGSFFEDGIWESSTSSEADPDRSLTSRMNSDGSPRAKARLVVRG